MMLYCVVGHIRLVTVQVSGSQQRYIWIEIGETVYVSLAVPRCIAHAKLVDLQADKSRVKDYINRLDNFDGPAVGEIAVGYEMFEEAFEIYKKFGLKSQAIKVLLDHQNDLDRAFEYAGKVGPQLSSFSQVSFSGYDAYTQGWAWDCKPVNMAGALSVHCRTHGIQVTDKHGKLTLHFTDV